MKSNILSKFLLLIGFPILIITSCSKAPENVTMIPSDAHFVTVYNIPSLINKAELFNANQLDAVKKLRANRKDFKDGEIKIIDRIFERPLSIGLNYEKDWFSFYLDEDENEERYFGMAISVIQEESVTDFIKELLDASNEVYEVKDKGTFKYTLTEKRTAFAWDKEKLLILGEESYRGDENSLLKKIESLFLLAPEKQLVKNSEFKEFYKGKKDISLWLSSNIFKEEREFKQFEEEYDIDASDNFMSFFLEFEEGQIDIDASFSGNESITSILEDNQILGDDFNENILEHFSDDNLSLTTLSINTTKLFDRIKDNSMVAMGNMSKVTPQEFLENMGGSIAFVVSNIEGTNASYGLKPSMSLIFDIKDKALIEELISIAPKDSYNEKDGYYEINSGRSSENQMFFTFNSTACLISNKEDLIQKFNTGKNIANNLADSDIVSEIDDNGLFFNVLLDEDKISDEVKASIERGQSSAEKEMMNVLKQLSESIDFKLSNKNTANLSLKIQDKEQNSLKVIIETFDDNYEKLEEL